MHNLTIGKKITLGFGLLFALLAIVAVIAYTSLGVAGRRFTLFADSAQETYIAASLELSMQDMKLQLTEFLTTGSAQDIADVEAAKRKLEAELDSAAKLTADTDRAKEIAKARELLAAYHAAFTDLVANHNARAALQANVLNPQSKIIAEGLNQMLAQAKTQGDMNAAFHISNGLQAFFESSSLVNSFLLIFDPVKAKGAREAIAVTVAQIQRMESDQVEMEKLDASLKDEPKKALLSSLLQAAAAYTDGLDQVVVGLQARNQILSARINRLAPDFTATLSKVKASVHNFQRDLENRTRTEQRHNEVMVLSITTAGILLGILLASFIIRGVSRGITAVAARLATESDKAKESAAQVASASQSMAEGASQQAGSLQETSASLHEMASMTQRNSENAQNAKTLANQARQTADAGAAEMEQMKSAMGAIKGSSVEISKIIKTIDEIAFQTNILALNAAVEAARAGEAGLGFAVVADEVRNLAQRCAGAARETAEKISASTEKSEQGVRISEKMATNLSAIVDKTRQLDERIGEIAQSSHEQSEGISQLNSAVASMDKITQDNAALAQQSASASEEMKEQAESVRAAVGELMRMAHGTGSESRTLTPPQKLYSARASSLMTPKLRGRYQNGSHANGNGMTNGTHGHRNGHAANGVSSSVDDLSFKDEA
ncbi:MAG TPA: methyl-accepting chemotaxis protein [Opitutaceae bacterium]|nr:methyl-accepting chemotaxis protein [Opitutaceae bacterium]